MADWLRNQHQGNEEVMPAVRHLAALPPTYPVAFALAASATQASASWRAWPTLFPLPQTTPSA